MTSKDLLYTIPENTIFTTIKDGKPVEVMAEYELIALTKGKYLELIKEANQETFKKARISKKQKTIFGGVGALFTFLGGLLAYMKKKKKKEGVKTL